MVALTPPRDLARTPALIALDWGTSSLRAFLMAADGAVLAERADGHGIQNLPMPGVAGFEAAFEHVCADWLAADPGLPVVACGMVGSAQGWVEAPYVTTPADTAGLAERAGRVTTVAGVELRIAPGVAHDPPGAAPDVMRGEEIQIAGALARAPEFCARSRMVLPGTHSKWVEIVDGRIVAFDTYMTGELFALLRRHSILARLMSETADGDGVRADSAFAAGLAAARGGALAHALFSVRTLGLFGRLAADELESYLSGLLIGHEVGAALAAAGEPDVPLVLIGESRLCRRYAEALAFHGRTPAAALGNTAPDGLFHFASALGAIPVPEETTP